ncbi:MAG TPA: phosphatase PAP2 family protein [Bryobacteraceae bacterium]|nr:phosphatase PAP2 family protein [Bryobacteraceae bacterium]
MPLHCQLLLAALIFTCHPVRSAELVLVWNDLTLRAIRYANIPPPMAVRQMAIVHLAIFDAANGLDPKYHSYLVTNAAPRECSLEAGTSTAAHHVLRTLFPKSADLLDSHYNAILAAIPNTPGKTNGLQWGKHVATEYLKLRQFDGAGQSAGYSYKERAGYWKRTPPNYDKPLLPAWGHMKPFAIKSPEEFHAAPPPALASSNWASQYNYLKAIGATNSTMRTPQQREIALFWADGPRTETPPGHWNKIAQQLARKKNYPLLETARLFAALNMAMADAAIVCWNTKYTYNWWRPVTAIRAGDSDDNPQTEPDPNWTPLLITPPFPEHTSGHSTFSGAAAAVLAEFSGRDEFQFVTSSDGLPGVVRRFERFSDAAREAGVSRIYGGIHFPDANEMGLAAGSKIGLHIARTMLQRTK